MIGIHTTSCMHIDCAQYIYNIYIYNIYTNIILLVTITHT